MTPYPVHPQKWTIDLLFKNNKIYSLKTIESTNTWQISRPPPFLPCARHKCMAPMHAINIHFYMHSYNYTTLFLTFLMQTKRDQKGNLIQYLTYQRQDTLRSRFTIIYSRCNVKERGQEYLCYLLHWKPFKSDEKRFLFHLKSSFRSQDI